MADRLSPLERGYATGADFAEAGSTLAAEMRAVRADIRASTRETIWTIVACNFMINAITVMWLLIILEP